MNKKNTEYLYNNFTHLYMDLGGPPSQTNMAFGLECGDGWFELIKELSKELTKTGAIATQVKEKYGSLRFYIRNATDEAFDLIDDAEAESAITCEECGEPGDERSFGGWITTRCHRCHDEDSDGKTESW